MVAWTVGQAACGLGRRLAKLGFREARMFFFGFSGGEMLSLSATEFQVQRDLSAASWLASGHGRNRDTQKPSVTQRLPGAYQDMYDTFLLRPCHRELAAVRAERLLPDRLRIPAA
jgi:hypothetical protein